MKQVAYICDACAAQSPNGLASYKLAVTRPPEWYDPNAEFPFHTVGSSWGYGLTPQAAISDRQLEVCRKCDALIQEGKLNPFTIPIANQQQPLGNSTP